MRPPPLEILGVTPGENTKAKSSSTMSRLLSLLPVCFRHFQQPIIGALLLHYTYVYLPNDRWVWGIYLLDCKDQNHRHSILTHFGASNWHSFAPVLATRSGATLNAWILVAIYQFRCRMSNTKVSPRFATPDGPVFVSSALCREIFHTYGMKFAPMDASGASQWTGLRPGKSNAARVEVAPAHTGLSWGTRIWVS
jgi:hypothetical protein